MKKNENQILGDKNPTNFNVKPTKFLRELYHVNDCNSNKVDVDTQGSLWCFITSCAFLHFHSTKYIFFLVSLFLHNFF